MSLDSGKASRGVALRRRLLERTGLVGRTLHAARRRWRPDGRAGQREADPLLAHVSARQEDIVIRLDDIGREIIALRGERHATAQALDEIDRRLRATQAMATRVYEQGQRLPERLAECRRGPEYEAAYAATPLVSVTVATYNRADLLCERALASLRRQSYENWEALVVGDCCTDDTEERIRALGDDRIRFENLPFRGPYPDDPREALLVYGGPPAKRALELAGGDWFAQLDDDDEWDDDHLEVLLDEARRTRAEVVYGKWRQRDARNGKLIAREFGEWPLRFEQFAAQAAIFHRALKPFGPDMNTRFSGEAGDWNRARRFWDGGVRFAFVDRPVTTIWFSPRNDDAASRFGWLTETIGYEGDAGAADR